MTRSHIAQAIADQHGLSKTKSQDILDTVIATLSGALAGGETIQLRGFGTFKVVSRAERVGRNPRTGDQVTIPATKKIKFKPTVQVA